MLSEGIELEIESSSSSIFASTLDFPRWINNCYLNDRVANTDQTIAVS